LEITVNFAAIHEHTMGWNETDAFGASDAKCVDKHGKTIACSSAKAMPDSYQTRLFPYGVHLDGDPTSTSAINSEGLSDTGEPVVGDALNASGETTKVTEFGEDAATAEAQATEDNLTGQGGTALA